jgi:homoserine kinase
MLRVHSWPTVPVKIRVPASIANLGPGFDVLAMAVDLWLEVEAEPAEGPDWHFTGEAAEHLNVTDNPLSKLPMRGRVRNGIPLGVGLGSSAAARLAAGALRGMGLDAAFQWAARQEGHPDNVAAAAYGGVRLLSSQVRSLPVPRVDLALLVASKPASTDAAREILPGQVPIGDAVYNAGRLAMLVHALHSGEYELLGEAMDDRLHQPYRRHLYPWTADAISAARSAGAHGAAIAGAGPTVFALCPPGLGGAIAASMAEAAPGMGRPLVTRVPESGMTVRT